MIKSLQKEKLMFYKLDHWILLATLIGISAGLFITMLLKILEWGSLISAGYSWCFLLLLMEKKEFKSSLSVLQRTYRIIVPNACLPKFSKCDIFLSSPGLRKIMTLSINHLQYALDIGYRAALEKEGELGQFFEHQ